MAASGKHLKYCWAAGTAAAATVQLPTGAHLNRGWPTWLSASKKLATASRCSSRCETTHAAAAAAKFVYVRGLAGSVIAHTAAYG